MGRIRNDALGPLRPHKPKVSAEAQEMRAKAERLKTDSEEKKQASNRLLQKLFQIRTRNNIVEAINLRWGK